MYERDNDHQKKKKKGGGGQREDKVSGCIRRHGIRMVSETKKKLVHNMQE